MAVKGEAPTKSPPTMPVAAAKTTPVSTLKAPLNRLVLACVGSATFVAAVGTAWRDGRGAEQAAPGLTASALIPGLEIDFASGAVALAVGLWLAERLCRSSDAAMAALGDALAGLAANPDPKGLKPLKAEGDLAPLAQSYNGILAGLLRRERKLSVHTKAQAEEARLAELAMLRQDIAGPLAAAKHLADGFTQADSTAEVARQNRRIAAALGRIGESVMATLEDFTRRAHGSQTSFDVQFAPVDLAELMEDVCALLWSEAAAKGLDLAVYIDPKTPLQISGDAVRLRQVIGGLASSALAATREGGVLIEVEPDSPSSLRISVHDTGPALAQQTNGAEPGTTAFDAQARLGDPDGHLSIRTGLYRQMVKAMGGAFAAPARRDRGVTFAFRLPAQIDETAIPWAGAAPSSEPLDAGAAPPRVLVAVRGPCTRRALGRYLARAGVVASAYDGGALPADARLLIGDAASLSAVGPLDIPVARIATPADLATRQAWSGPAAFEVLSRPLNRAELETLLRKVNSGQPLQAGRGTALPIIDAPVGRTTTTLSDDEKAMLADLDLAAERDEFSLAYQPQVEREGERIIGVEALLRWTHPTRGSVSPSVFIPLAEKTGRIARVTAWVIERVLAETLYLSGLQVSFNASALEFADEGFVDRLLAAVAETGYDARRLEVEITETAILHHEKPVLESMNRLHAAGIGVALDDFGAGYSSLSHLRRYPFDKLKIDREFITDCSRDMESATVVHAVVSIGRALGMKVIAEGVETETQRNFLRIAGVYAMQGYLFGKPVPIDHLAPLIGAARAQARG
jgi:EAL domain-containing protein (putative c-di-GMP-specific phosphodiesterase class I)/signal transduction histidine kinase